MSAAARARVERERREDRVNDICTLNIIDSKDDVKWLVG